ncbi:hypothetical protein X777_16313 [Ooceraea biroi]|uniref:Uncharacterized protein n=1 Tax=Ooceraea biroi TaxID=2015173 RepID=A0A026VV41_OOCBI|nr:hypothetical protein X777_16313 [Ooceraea biroi]
MCDFCIAEFPLEKNATSVIPSSWIKTKEGSTFCLWPTKLSNSETSIAIKRGDSPDADWEEKLIIKIYPKKRCGVPFKKCQNKHSALYNSGSTGLDTEDTENDENSIENAVPIFPSPIGYSCKRPSKTSKPPCAPSQCKKQRLEVGSDLSGFKDVGSQSSSKEPNESNSASASEEHLNNVSQNITSSKCAEKIQDSEEDSDVNSSSGTSDAESSNFEDKDAERNKNNTLIQEFNAENKSTKVIDSFLDQQFKKSGIDTTNELGIMSEYTIRRLFRWMYKLNLQNKQLQQSIEELKSMLQRKSFKTSATVVPDLILPCANPDEDLILDYVIVKMSSLWRYYRATDAKHYWLVEGGRRVR